MFRGLFVNCNALVTDSQSWNSFYGYELLSIRAVRGGDEHSDQTIHVSVAGLAKSNPTSIPWWVAWATESPLAPLWGDGSLSKVKMGVLWHAAGENSSTMLALFVRRLWRHYKELDWLGRKGYWMSNFQTDPFTSGTSPLFVLLYCRNAEQKSFLISKLW